MTLFGVPPRKWKILVAGIICIGSVITGSQILIGFFIMTWVGFIQPGKVLMTIGFFFHLMVGFGQQVIHFPLSFQTKKKLGIFMTKNLRKAGGLFVFLISSDSDGGANSERRKTSQIEKFKKS